MNGTCDCTSCQDVAQQLRDNPDMSMSQVIQEMSEVRASLWERNTFIVSDVTTVPLNLKMQDVSKHFFELRKNFESTEQQISMKLSQINVAKNLLMAEGNFASKVLGFYLDKRELILTKNTQNLKDLKDLSHNDMSICEQILQKAEKARFNNQGFQQWEESFMDNLASLNAYSEEYFGVIKEMTLELNKFDVKCHWPHIPESSNGASVNNSTKAENNGKVEVESNIREETLDILQKMLEAKKKEAEVTATASKEIATMSSDKFAISERLEGLSSVKDDAVRRIKQLSQIIDDMGGKEITIHNVEKHAAECLDVETYLSKFLTEVVPMEGMFAVMKEDRKVAKRTQKKWENRFEKAQKAVIEAKGAGRTRQAGEFRKLREIALQTSEQMRGNVKALEQNIESTQSILHDVNMAKTKLLTVIVSCNRFIRDSAMASKSAEKTTLVLASAFENINKLEENINKRGVRALTA